MLSTCKKIFSILRTYFALLVVLAVFIWSAVAIVSYRAKQAPPDSIVIRLGHWQLEASVREAIDDMAEKYREINPRVVIIQDAIPEGTYGQWVSTQLMGGTAPDILQVGSMLPDNIWLSYYNRYFQPLSRYVYLPNPHNKGTDLETIPLRQTFKDGMKTAYVSELQEYMSMPLSQFGVRIFYNRDLLKELTGLDEAPLDYREFLAVCAKIGAQTNPASGEKYTPIAGSQYHFGHWDSMMFSPVTYGGIRRADFNRDGFVGNDETFVAFMTGLVDFTYPPYACWLKMLREVTDHFQTGYTGLGRDEAVFLFAQQRAVFMTTGTWDARSLQQQAAGQFEVGIMDFPLPSPDDPVYGGVVEGRVYESPGAGFRFGISRTSKNFDIALDFLLFISSQKGNEELNRIIGWIPSVRGTEVDPLLEAFEPHVEGIYGAIALSLGGNTATKWTQVYSLYQVNQSTLEKLSDTFIPYYLENGYKDFLEQQRDWRRGMHNNEQYLAGIRASAIMAEGDEAQSAWVRYRAITSGRQIWSELNHARQMALVKTAVAFRATQTNSAAPIKMPDMVGPYEYSDAVLEKIRARLRAEAKLVKAKPKHSASVADSIVPVMEAITQAEADLQKNRLLDDTAARLVQIDEQQAENAEILTQLHMDLPVMLDEIHDRIQPETPLSTEPTESLLESTP